MIERKKGQNILPITYLMLGSFNYYNLINIKKYLKEVRIR